MSATPRQDYAGGKKHLIQGLCAIPKGSRGEQEKQAWIHRGQGDTREHDTKKL